MAQHLALEIVQQRNDGWWYTSRREYNQDSWQGMVLWIKNNPGAMMRWIDDPGEPLLSASRSYMAQTADKIVSKKGPASMPYSQMPYITPKAEAEQEGFDFARSFSSCVVVASAPSDALYQLGYYFAKNYSTDVDIVGAYVSGFIRGWVKPTVAPAQQISAPSHTVSADS